MGDSGSIPPQEDTLEKELQDPCLGNPMDRGAWQATVHGVARVRHDLVTKPPPPPPCGMIKGLGSSFWSPRTDFFQCFTRVISMKPFPKVVCVERFLLLGYSIALGCPGSGSLLAQEGETTWSWFLCSQNSTVSNEKALCYQQGH